MVPLEAEMTITSIVDAFLKRDDYVTKDYRVVSRHGVVLRLNLSASSYEDEGSYHASRQLVILCTGNTSVFVAVAPPDGRYFGWQDVPKEAWKNTSNHDSCWRSDGIQSPITDQYFSMCEEINEMRKADGLEPVAPINMHHFNHLDSHPLVTEVDVTTESDPDTHNPSYFRRIVKIVAR